MIERPRRLRQNAALRALVAETRLHPRDLVLPVFVAEGITEPRPITSMPGVDQHTLESVVEVARRCVAAGLGGIMLFGVPEHKDATGSGGIADDGILNLALRAVRDAVGDDLVVMADTCLDEFTDHGHCGVLDEQGRVDNDATNLLYAQMAVAQARAGAHVVAPSGMMDGQVAVIREALDAEGLEHVVVLAYAAKYAIRLLRPLPRGGAVEPAGRPAHLPAGPRQHRRVDPRDRPRHRRGRRHGHGQAGHELPRRRRAAAAERASVPVAAYQVSGEYSMIQAAAAQGWIDLRATALESLTSIRRAGAQVVLTYFALDVADWLA